MQQTKILFIAFMIFILSVPLQASIAYAEQDQENNTVAEAVNKGLLNESNNIEDTQIDDEIPNSVGVWDLMKMIFATIFVLILIYLLIKFVNKKSSIQSNLRYVENLGGTSLGSNRSVQLIKVGKRILVVGVGEDIQLLREIDNEHEVQQIVDDHHNKLNQMVQPAHLVKKLISSRHNKQHEDDENFASVLKSQLDELSVERKRVLHEQDKERD
ncbi:flagellar biosynthetic protein FliO [Cytobacillus sp. Hm23]